MRIIEYMQNRTCFCTDNTCCLAFHRDILFFQLLGRRIEFLADRIDFITDNLAQIQKRGLGHHSYTGSGYRPVTFVSGLLLINGISRTIPGIIEKFGGYFRGSRLFALILEKIDPDRIGGKITIERVEGIGPPFVTMLIGQLIGAFFQQSFNTEFRTSENSSCTIHFFFQPIMVDDLNQRIELMVGMRRQVIVRRSIRLCRMGSTIVQVILNTGCHSE